jgi:hypothetical protein
MKRPTTWEQWTVDELGRVIVPPEPHVRHVRVIVPDHPSVELHLYASLEDLRKVIADDGRIIDTDILSQDSLSPLMPADVTIPLTIAPGQAMTARTREGMCDLSVIVEYP